MLAGAATAEEFWHSGVKFRMCIAFDLVVPLLGLYPVEIKAAM